MEKTVFHNHVVIFLNYASSAAALVIYLPFSGPIMKCTHRGKTERPESGNILKFSKKTQHLMNTLYVPKCYIEIKNQVIIRKIIEKNPTEKMASVEASLPFYVRGYTSFASK